MAFHTLLDSHSLKDYVNIVVSELSIESLCEEIKAMHHPHLYIHLICFHSMF